MEREAEEGMIQFLPLARTELNLRAVLRSGQSFRWIRQSPPIHTLPLLESDDREGEEWIFPHQTGLIILRQTPLGIFYRSHPPSSTPDRTLEWINKYFQLNIPLTPLYEKWSERDPFFKRVVVQGERREELMGIRVLDQDPWETLIAFICSSNNNIPRITLMLTRLCQSLGTPFDPDRKYYSFPPPEKVAKADERLLRELGFGYRAPYVISTAQSLLEISSSLGITPSSYLESLRCPHNLSTTKEEKKKKEVETKEKLMEFKGVGPKVASCIMLFSLGFDELVPVDTHVFQIAVRDYGFPANKNTTMSPALGEKVEARLREVWGEKAGWAQQVVFYADLKTPSTSPSPAKSRSTSRVVATAEGVKKEWEYEEEILDEEGRVKSRFELEIEELQRTPGKKRTRTQRVVTVTENETIVKEEEADPYPSPISTKKVVKRRKVVKVESSPIKS